MSGRKQHFIPQFLLGGFGARRGGKKIQVTAYTREQGVFTVPTDGIGAERHFYSELPVEGGDPTLDDRITQDETSLAGVVAKLRVAADGADVDAKMAAVAVHHLTRRNAHMRKAFALAARDLMDAAVIQARDKERTRREFGLHLNEPTGRTLAELQKIWATYGDEYLARGASKEQVLSIGFERAKARFDEAFRDAQSSIREMADALKRNVDHLIKNAHNSVLEEDTGETVRAELLKRLNWFVLRTNDGEVVLPDCIVLERSRSGSLAPTFFVPAEDMLAAFMPLSHDAVLVGASTGRLNLQLPSAADFAACSWDFFVGRSRTDELERLVPVIGERVRSLLDAMVDEATAGLR